MILKALLVLTDNSDPSCYNESSSLVRAKWNFDFVFGLLILRLILSSTDALSRYLQGKDKDVITAKRTADAVVLTLRGCRNEERFELFWESVGRIVSQIKEGIKDTNFSFRDPRLPRRKPSKRQQTLVGENQENHQEISPKDHYRFAAYYESVDTAMAEIKSRFAENDQHILCALADVVFSNNPD